MFRYSIDEFIASKQEEEANALLRGIKKSGKPLIQYSEKIDNVFVEQKISNYKYLEGFSSMTIECNDRIVVVAIPRKHDLYATGRDFKIAIDRLYKSWTDVVPYITHSFPEEYECPHGDSYKHVFLFFFNKYYDFAVSEEATLSYLKKFNNLKAFI